MKITRRRLHYIIEQTLKEVHPRAEADNAYVADLEKRDDLIDSIRDFSKELTGRRDTYGAPEKLDKMDTQQLDDYYQDMFHSSDYKEFTDHLDQEKRDRGDASMGYEGEASREEMAPQRQGMRRRPAGRKAQRRMESINQIVRNALNEADEDKDQQAAFEPAKSGKTLVKMVDKAVNPKISPQMFTKFDKKIDDSDNAKYQAQAIAAFMMDYADNDKDKLTKIFQKLKAELPPILKSYDKKDTKDKGDVKTSGDKKAKPKKITFE